LFRPKSFRFLKALRNIRQCYFHSKWPSST
jgi:hypothetical protein